jgi:hypothetical protein
LVVLLIFLSAPTAIYKAIKHAERRKPLAVKSLIWISMAAGVIIWHIHLHRQAQLEAQQIVQKIERYRETHGAYPPDISEIGITKEEIRKTLGYAGYYNKGGQVALFYGSTYVPFEQESYDFVTRRWSHIGD